MLTSKAEVSLAALSQSTQGSGREEKLVDVRLRTSVPPHTCLPARPVRGPSPRRSLSRWTDPAQRRGQRLGMLRGSRQGALPAPRGTDTLALSGIAVPWCHFQLRSGPLWSRGEEEKGRRQREAERDREKQREKNRKR